MDRSLNDEKVLIGAAILMGDSHCSINLEPSDFVSDFYGAVWKYMRTVKDVDVATIESEFFDRRADLADCVSSTGASSNMNKIAGRISEAAHRRRLLEAIVSAHAIIKGGGSIADATTAIDKAADGITTGDGWKDISEGLRMAYDSIDEATKTGENINFVSTGIKAFDDEFGGLQKNGLIIISGRPGSGKSSLAAGIARHSGRKHPCLITTFEMGMEQVCMRYFGMEAKVDMSNAMRGDLTGDECSKLFGAIDPLADAGIKINDTTFRTIDGIVAEGRRFKRVHDGIGLLIVDHLGLLDKGGRNNLEFIEDATRKMKLLATELECPILLLVQMNRNVESRATGKPQMSDLRGCGSIEADADQIIFPVIDQDEKSKPQFKGLDDGSLIENKKDKKKIGNATLYIEKNRNGDTGEVRVQWIGKHTTFKDAGGSNDYS